MATAALVLAAAVALLSVPTVAGLTAWGLAGGDGEPGNALLGPLAVCVMLGSLYNVVTAFHAFDDIATWRWWAMWLPAVAGLLGIALSFRDQVDWPFGDLLPAVAVPAALAVPAVLVLLAGAVEPVPGDARAPTSPSPTAEPSAQRPTTEPTAGPAAGVDDVLVVNRARSVSEVSTSRAERIRAGGVRGWRLVETVVQVTRDPRAAAFVPLRQVRPWVRAVSVGGVDPLSGTTTVRVVGDIMLDRGVAAASPPDDPVWTLRTVRGLLTGADLTVGNLEMALSENGTPQQPGDDSFASSPAVLDGLADLGIDALSLANNHTGDYGQTALLETVAAVRRSPVVGFGAGRDLAAASRPVVLDADGLRVGLVGFNAIGETARATADSPGALTVRMPPRTGPLDEADLRHLLDAVRRADRRADVVVVMPHWGGNYTHVADPAQTQVARRLAAAGADLVAGGHPHWVQGLERVGDGVVAHSLGNLVFDMDFMEQTMEGVALTARFAADRLVAVQLTPYRLDGSFRPRVVGGAEASAVLEDVRAHSRGAFSAP